MVHDETVLEKKTRTNHIRSKKQLFHLGDHSCLNLVIYLMWML